MATGRACAVAHPNIALIKYWGNVDPDLRLPANGSISLTLDGLETRTLVEFLPGLRADEVVVDKRVASASTHARVGRLLDRVRSQAPVASFARVESVNSFPTGAGLASSASAFAALAVAASAAAGLQPPPEELSRLARLGSGSACRSVWGGFAEWLPGHDHASSYAVLLADREHWDLRDVVVVLSRAEKPVGSSQGHARAATSPFQAARVVGAPARLTICRRAVLGRDFEGLAAIVEEDSQLMHQVMATSDPPLTYSLPSTNRLKDEVQRWRAAGLAVAYTQDAGPNLHLLCPAQAEEEVIVRLAGHEEIVDIIRTRPGGPPREIEPSGLG